MKKFFAILTVAAFVFVACNQQKTESTEPVQAEATQEMEADVLETEVADMPVDETVVEGEEVVAENPAIQ